MKSLLAVVALLCLSAAVPTSARAAPPLIQPALSGDSRTDLPIENILPPQKDYDRVLDVDVGRMIDKQNWCAQAIPQPQKGEATIYYRRDKNGHCTVRILGGDKK